MLSRQVKLLGLLILIVGGSVGCIGSLIISNDEVARVTVPDGSVDAVLIELHGGATTSMAYEIHILPKGGKPSKTSRVAFLYRAIRNQNAYGVNLKWDTGDALIAEYLSATTADLQQPVISIKERRFTVHLKSGVIDPTAPPGGMMYNLLGRPNDPK